MNVYYAHVGLFSEDFFEKAISFLPKEKLSAVQKLKHRPSAKESILAWSLVVYAFQTRFGKMKLPALRFTEKGKPYFPDVQFCFNVSHSGGWCVAAVSESEVGVDIQEIIPCTDRVKIRVLSGKELTAIESQPDADEAFIDIWSRKESYLKYTGQGISEQLQAVDFSGVLSKEAFAFRGLNFMCRKLENCRLSVCSPENDFHFFEICEEDFNYIKIKEFCQ